MYRVPQVGLSKRALVSAFNHIHSTSLVRNAPSRKIYNPSQRWLCTKQEQPVFDAAKWEPVVPPKPLKFNYNDVDETVVTQVIGTVPEIQYIPETIENGAIIYEGPLSWASKFVRKLSLFSSAIILPLAPLPWFLGLETLSLTSRLMWSVPLFLYPLFSTPLIKDVCNPYVHSIQLIKGPNFKGGILDPVEIVPEEAPQEVKVKEEVGELFDLDDELTLLSEEEQDRRKRDILARRKEAEELEKDKTHPIPPDPYERLFASQDESEEEILEITPFAERPIPTYRYNVDDLYLRLHTTDLFGKKYYWTVAVDDLEPTWGNISGFNNYYSKSLQRYFAIQEETLRRACGQEWLWFYWMCKHELSTAEIEAYEIFVKTDKQIRLGLDDSQFQPREEREQERKDQAKGQTKQ